MVELSTKCWNSAFNAQGSRLTIVVVQVWSVKIHVPAVEALRQKERKDRTKLSLPQKLMVLNTKSDGFLSFTPPLNVNVLVYRFFFWISPCVWPSSGFWRYVCLTLGITLLWTIIIKSAQFATKAWILTIPSSKITRSPIL
jgi:hypothetical protein